MILFLNIAAFIKIIIKAESNKEKVIFIWMMMETSKFVSLAQ
jgi:hypothetical protein